ncbi:MAG TPA: hypothetical protein PKD29_10180, partial [Rhodocyclaceae bacterium]|nr:hypothetical protein [Rhodocyclaceae bacterium]
SGFLTLRADNNVVLRDVTAGGFSVSQANNQVFSPVASNGSCETIGSGFVCAPNSVAMGNITDPTGTGSFSATARHGITAGNLAVGNLNFTTYTGTVNTGTIGTALAPAGSVVISADNYTTYAGGNIVTGAVEANSVSMTTLNGNIQTGAINAVNTGASSVQLAANSGNVTVTGTVDASYIELRASGAGATGNVTVGNLNPDAATTGPGTVNLYADTSIAAGTIDADQITAAGWSCCPTFPSITAGAIGGRRPGNYLYVSGSDVTLGALTLDGTGVGQTLEVRGTNNVTVTGNVGMGLGGDMFNPARLDAGNLLTFNGGNGVFAATDGSAVLLHAGNALTATPFAFRRVDAGATGWVTIDAPAGIRQTLEAAGGGGIRAGTVILKATAGGSSIDTQEGTNPITTLTLRETADLTIDSGGDLRIQLTGASGAPELHNLDITRARNDGTYVLNDGAHGPNDLNAAQSLSVVDNGSGVDLTLTNAGSTALNFRFRNTDGSGNIVVKGTGIATKGGFVKLESATGQVSNDPGAAIDSTDVGLGDGAVTITAATGIDLAGPVTAGAAAVTMSTGGNLFGTSTITGGAGSLSSLLGDIGDGLGGAIAITAPTVSLTATRNLGPGVGGTIEADLTGTAAVSVNADAGFTVASNTTLTSAAITTRGDQAGPLFLSAPGQSFGLTRNLTTVELGTVSSASPLTGFSLTVNAGDLTVVGTGVSQVAANNLQLTTAGILTLDGTGARVVLGNANQTFSAGGDLLVIGQANLTATGTQQFLGGQGGSGDVSFQPSGGGIIANAATQSFGATRDLLFDGGAASNENIALSATGSQAFSAGRDIRLAGGAGASASVGATLTGNGGQSLSASGNIDLLGGSGTGSAVNVVMTGDGNQSLNASGNISLSAGAGDDASVLVSATGAGVQSFYANGNFALNGGGISATTANAAVLVLKAGSNTQTLDAGGAITLAGGDGDGGSVTVRNTGSGNQVLGDNYCCSNPTDSLSLAGGDGLDSYALIENAGAGRQFIQPVVSLSLAGGAGNGAYARIHNANATSASTSVSNGPQIIGYSNTYDCCSGDQIDTMSLVAGSGTGAYAEISSAGSQRLAFGTSITIAGGSGDGAFGRVTAKAQDLRTGNFVLTAGTGNGADASIVASGTEADRTAGSSALQSLDPGTVTMTAGGTAGANAAAAYITSGGTQRITASTTQMTGGAGPDSFVRIAAAGNQNLSFGNLTLQGGTGANTRAAIESQSGGQSISASTTQLLGGTGLAGVGQDAGALVINNAGAQTLNLGNLTIRSGADFAPAGIANLGTTQSVSAGAVTIGTTAGANGVASSPLGGNNTAAIGNLGGGSQSLNTSSITIDNQQGNGDIGIFSNTTQTVSTGTVTVNNATASGIARIDSAGTQGFSAGNVTVTSAGAAGEARITAAGTQTFSDSGLMTVQVTAGAGTARVSTSTGAQTITSSGGLRVQATGGSGTARVTAPAGQ